jgi:hypothetical protein
MQSCTALLSQYARRIATPALLAARRRAASTTFPLLAAQAPSTTAMAADAASTVPITEQDEASRRPAPTEPLLSIAPM